MRFSTDWAKRSKSLTQALILSGTLNIALLATFAYFVLQEKQERFTLSLSPKIKQEHLPTNGDTLKRYSLLPYQELLSELTSSELVEEGFMKRDLALACLVSFHHFNLSKALGGIPLQKREISFTHSTFDQTLTIPLFAGLSDTHFSAILQYARTEKWPLTSQGLFYEIKRMGEERDFSLLTTFYLTPEFYSAYTLFQKSGQPLSREELIALLSEGNWEIIETLHQEMRLALDLSPDRRRALLLEYLHHHSSKAAQILLSTEREFIAKRGSDAQILTLLDLPLANSKELELFAKDLLLSPRTETVWKKAASILAAAKGIALSEPYDHAAVLHTFCPESVQTSSLPPTPTPSTLVHAPVTPLTTIKKKIHVIEVGDNLWKIARRYKVSIEEIRKLNHLDNDRLRPGKELEIPQQ